MRSRYKILIILILFLYTPFSFAKTAICTEFLEYDLFVLDNLILHHDLTSSTVAEIRSRVKSDLSGCAIPPDGINEIGSSTKLKSVYFAILADEPLLVGKIIRETKKHDPTLHSLLGIAGSTPLGFAAYYGTPGTIAALLNEGYTISSSVDNFGNTALMTAPGGVEEDAKNVKYLIENGAAINFSTSKGNTALLSAIIAQDIPAVKYLLSHGAIVDLPCPHVTPAREVAFRTGNKEIISIVKQWDDKPNKHVHINDANDKVICGE